MPRMHECVFTRNGVEFSADYEACGDVLVVFLPDDSSRKSLLRGRDPHAVALEHLMFYVDTLEGEDKGLAD